MMSFQGSWRASDGWEQGEPYLLCSPLSPLRMNRSRVGALFWLRLNSDVRAYGGRRVLVNAVWSGSGCRATPCSPSSPQPFLRPSAGGYEELTDSPTI